jgi:(1->4)-alpha-D-glucan 1-alpha-D-glucosylmutase
MAPSATYRIQFSLNFRFAAARDLIPYLHDLGIRELYASPRFQARQGSSHGYDVTDPQRINSELGTEEEFEELVQRLKDYGMGLLLDIVPNHMAVSAENPWWMDVLENGVSSPFAAFFDIDWHLPITKSAALEDNRVLLPILGNLYGRVLENQEILLRLEESGFSFRYWESKFPLHVTTYWPVLEAALSKVSEQFGIRHPAIEKVMALKTWIDQAAQDETSVADAGESNRTRQQQIKARLWQIFREDEDFRKCLEGTLHEWNGTKDATQSFVHLDQLLAKQAYRLAFWRMAIEEINYRRFFDINELVGLHIEIPEVFQARHSTVLKLIEEGKVTGLRIDHIDGLYDPQGYLDLLKRKSSREPNQGESAPYLIVEKILGGNERLPSSWPVAGTTGYDFLNAQNGIFIDAKGLDTLEAIYAKFIGVRIPFAEWCFRGNKLVLQLVFAGDVRRLGYHLGRLAATDRCARDVPIADLLDALTDVTACLPVYRTYVSSDQISRRDRSYLERALEMARSHGTATTFRDAAFEFLRRVLFMDLPDLREEDRSECLRFVMRWQQFSGAVMAKGLEDTAFYIHNSLISLNEVGGDPLRAEPPLDVASFHMFNQERQARWPGTLNCTSTHDTKRSEDARARINVLSELATEWGERAFRWRRWNHAKKQRAGDYEVPAPLEEMFLYQTMLGSWPLEESEVPAFADRLTACMVKAAREAKLFTSWIAPQEAYENALGEFIKRILDASEENRFLSDFLRFQKRVAFYGALNSLSQVLVKIGAPGLPDFYQGTELWDFSMVDPDNRRPVDFQQRARLLAELAAAEHGDRESLLHDILEHWQDGRIKLYLTWKALGFRGNHAELFAEGDYVPMIATGKKNENVCAFARRKGKDHAPRRRQSNANGARGLGQKCHPSAGWRTSGMAKRPYRRTGKSGIDAEEKMAAAAASTSQLSGCTIGSRSRLTREPHRCLTNRYRIMELPGISTPPP